MPEHQDTIAGAFSAQAAGYDASPTTNAAEILDRIAELVAPAAGERWLDAACGTGIVSRRIAPLVGEVLGIDLTPGMLEIAREHATAEHLENVTFTLGDGTATGLPSGSLDGALTRFSLHHIPVPGRLLVELARVVRPGGRIVVVDHVADRDGEARAFAEEIERLRDPAHWASLTPERLRELGAVAGLRPVEEALVPFPIDFDEWLIRGTSDPDAHRLVERRLAERPDGTDRFALRENRGGGDGRPNDDPGARTLTLQVWFGAWTVPS